MRTAIDTNVISAIWSREPAAAFLSEQLFTTQAQGALAISGPVYAELLAHPLAAEEFIAAFLAETGIATDFGFHESVWKEGGRRYASYAARRRKSKTHGEPRRVLADFLIGAHALLHADRLITLDHRRYQKDFPELRLL